MGFQVSPGVQIQERDLSTIIPAVATTSAAIAGQFKWGPVDQRIIVDSENNLVQLFGIPDNTTAKYFYPAANFLQYGNSLQVVRVVDGVTAATAVAGVAGLTGLTGANAIKNSDQFDANFSYLTNNYNGLSGRGAFAAKYIGALGNSLRIDICDSVTGFSAWSLSGQFSNAPGTSLDVAAAEGNNANDEIHVAIVDAQGLITGSPGSILEKYEGLSKATDARKGDGSSNFIVSTLAQSKYVYPINTLPGITYRASVTGGASFGTLQNAFGSGITGLGQMTFTGGADSATLSNDQLVFGVGAGATASGYNLFTDADTVDVSILIGGPLTGSAAGQLADIAKARKDCIAVFSADNLNPTDNDTVKTTRCTNLKNSIGENSYAFIDSTWKYQYDRYNDIYRWVPMNGDIAGLMVRTDQTNDPWWSPAGYNRGQIRNVIKLGFNPTLTFRDIIYPKGINPIVTFPGQGTVLFGDRTAQTKPSAFDRINVRRLFIVLEKAIAIAAKYQLFEFNDVFTRAQLVSMIEPFLRDVQARRGIYAFKVICDETNNPPSVIDSNSLACSIYIQPAKSINFIQLSFIATRTGVNFSEIAALNTPAGN